mgnify:CR=1 FL=1
MNDDIRFPANTHDLLDRVVNAFQIRVLWKDKDSRYIDCNQAFAEDAGFQSPQDVIGKTEFDMPWKNDNAQYHLQTDREVMSSGEPLLSFEQALTASGGRKRWILTSKMPMRDSTGQINGVLVLYQDTTFIKDLERERTELDRAYHLLRDVNRTMITAIDEARLFDEVCRLIVANGYKMAWIGLLLHDDAKTIQPVAYAGFLDGYLDRIRITWADDEFGHGPTGTAARKKQTIVNQNFLTNPDMLPWRESALAHGYQSSIAMPLTTEAGEAFAVLTIYATDPNAFDQEEADKLGEMAQTLSFGHQAILARQRRFEVLEKSVGALAATVESRDPYTAGHQSRVAEIALNIARNMGLDAETCTGIKLAALIHDMGKIQIPIELLTKPTHLSDLEMAMIRMHPDVGYGIVKDIPFPWPVAEMVHQHHERMDGSGYPKGLKGEEILLGARIIAVADVLEAISSYRPYRPALGMDVALREIEAQRGILFDPAVVDSCLALYRKPD